MKISISKGLLGAALLLVLSIGSGGLNHATAAAATMDSSVSCPNTGNSHAAYWHERDGDSWGLSGNARWVEQRLRKDNIRWAQVELRTKGLYHGSLDGVLGPETQQALRDFQQSRGLSQSASLDRQTWEALTGDAAAAAGSSLPPIGESQGSVANTPERNDLGR